MQDLLRQVSRSFYLTLRILPRSIRPQLSLAYLLARAADTIVDTQLVDVRRRREALAQFRNGIGEACAGRVPTLPYFGEFAEAQETVAGQGTPAERALLKNPGKLLGSLQRFSNDDRLQIRRVLETITHGQEMDLIRFGAASAAQIAALGSDEDLDLYTYDVAGSVGEFWTQVCRAHVFPKIPLDNGILFARAVRFGKGLQLVNILRDLPKDLRQGRCYLPEERLLRHGLKPGDLLDRDAMGRFRPLYHDYLRQAMDHLHAGWQYTLMLPFRYARIRLACAWPILIGVRTLEQLRIANILDDQHRIKVSRSGIRRLILRSMLLYPNRGSWNRLFDSLHSQAK